MVEIQGIFFFMSIFHFFFSISCLRIPPVLYSKSHGYHTGQSATIRTDPHMEGELRVVKADVARDSLRRLLEGISGDVLNLAPQSALSAKILKVKTQFNEYEELPRLLDGDLQWYIATITDTYLGLRKSDLPTQNRTELCESLCELVYVLAKVRGYKFVLNFFDNDVYMIRKLLDILQDDYVGDFETYTVLLWLSSLVMVPFPLTTIECNIEQQISTMAAKHMALHTNASKCQVMALALLSNLVTRPDCTHLLKEYVQSISDEWATMLAEHKLGHLLALNQILKRHSRLEVCELAEHILTMVVVHDLAQLKHNLAYRVNSMHVLYLVKISSKICRISISRDNYDSVSLIVNSYIHDIMSTLGERLDAKLRETIAKNLSRIVSYLNAKAVNYADQLVWFVIGQLGVPELQGNTFQTLNFTPESFDMSRYHTVTLFLGFLALTKAVSSSFIPTIISVFHSTCTISKRTYYSATGSQIRDSSCFCAWAVLKSLSVDDFAALGSADPSMWDSVFLDLMAVTIFDEDFTIRRCGIAVLQEFVGRFGSQYFREKFPGMDDNDIGVLTLSFIERFGSSTVGNLHDSHELITGVLDLGIPASVFLGPLHEETTNKEVPFEFRKLGSRYLSPLMEKQSRVQWNVPKMFNISDIVADVRELFQNGDHASLYTLAELYLHGHLSKHDTDLISRMVCDISLEGHHEISTKAESLLHWYNVEMLLTSKLDPNLGQNVIAMSMLAPTSSLTQELSEVFSFLANSASLAVSLDTLFRHLSRGSTLLARTSVPYILAQDGTEQILYTVTDFSVDADVRSDIIGALSGLLTEPVHPTVSSIVLDLLDDYTLTNQGDVGLKVRGACILLVEENLAIFQSVGPDLERKLVRLAAEPMDRIRVASFRLLCKVKQETRFDSHFDIYMSDYRLYFDDLGQFYESHVDDTLRPAFWKGMVHTAGALKGNNTLINISFRRCLLLVYRESADIVVMELARFLRIPPQQKVVSLSQRTKKTFNTTLNFLGKLFDCFVLFGPKFEFNTLYVRAYNLHINNSDLTRIGLVLRVLQFLATWGTPHDIQSRSRARLCWLTCFHPSDKIRVSSAESLFEVANELDPEHSILNILDSTDWAGKRTQQENASLLLRLQSAYSNM